MHNHYVSVYAGVLGLLSAWSAISTRAGTLTGVDENWKGVVTISTPKGDCYLLGEAVELEITFRNLSQQDRKLPEHWSELDEPPIHVNISTNGVKYDRFEFGYDIGEPIGTPQRTVKPGESWNYRLHLLFSRIPPGKLAFDKPGKYFLRTGDAAPSSNTWHARSNVLSVRILDPSGLDAKVWEQMNDKRVFELLQSGIGQKESALKVGALLREFPRTKYRSTLWYGLREFYYRQSSRQRALIPEVRESLGIQEPKEIGDDRLNNLVRGVQDQALRVEDLLQDLSSQTGLQLVPSPELKKKVVRLSLAHRTLGECMTTVSNQLKAPWRPHENGYSISTDPPVAKAK